MKVLSICRCGRQAAHRHHKFPQHKHNREKYGDLLDLDFNIEMMCENCHSSHANIEKVDTEQMFLDNLKRHIKFLINALGDKYK